MFRALPVPLSKMPDPQTPDSWSSPFQHPLSDAKRDKTVKEMKSNDVKILLISVLLH